MADTPNADRLAAMSDAELIDSAAASQDAAWLSIHALDRIASLVVEKLGQSVIPSSFPPEIGEWIRDACKHGAAQYRHIIPMNGPTAIFVEYRVNPDGTLNQEFLDTNGCPFWRGTFRPANE